MQVLQQLGVEAVAGGAAVAGVRPGSRCHDAEQHGDEHGSRGEVGQHAEHRGSRVNRRPRPVVDAVDEHRGERDEHDACEEVEADHVGVEVGEHGDSAENRLQDDAEAGDEGENEEVAALTAQPHDEQEGDDGDDLDDEEQQPVAELDDAVDAHLGRGDEGAVGALRPGGASEPGGGETHCPAREHDE